MVNIQAYQNEGILFSMPEGILFSESEGILISTGEGILFSAPGGILFSMGEGIQFTISSRHFPFFVLFYTEYIFRSIYLHLVGWVFL